MSLMASFCAVLFPLDVLDEIWDLIESVSKGFPTYSSNAGAFYNVADSRARAYCTYSRCGWGLFGQFYSPLSFLLFLPLSGRRPDID